MSAWMDGHSMIKSTSRLNVFSEINILNTSPKCHQRCKVYRKWQIIPDINNTLSEEIEEMKKMYFINLLWFILLFNQLIIIFNL